MKVEVLYFDGCPNAEALVPHLRELLASCGIAANVELVEIEDLAAAERGRFLGSPTVRIDGKDVEPGASAGTSASSAGCSAGWRGCGGCRPTSGCWPALQRAKAGSD